MASVAELWTTFTIPPIEVRSAPFITKTEPLTIQGKWHPTRTSCNNVGDRHRTVIATAVAGKHYIVSLLCSIGLCTRQRTFAMEPLTFAEFVNESI